MCCEFQDGGCSNSLLRSRFWWRHVVNKFHFLSDFKANIIQEKDQKSFFDLYSGSKEIDFSEKFAQSG